MEQIYLGNKKIARIYNQGQVIHPNPVRDELVLWYDFMGAQNSDAKRGIAEDLSGNGNNGTLVNFAYDVKVYDIDSEEFNKIIDDEFTEEIEE